MPPFLPFCCLPPPALQVIVKTSDVRGAGTDSNVTLVMQGLKEGQNMDSGVHKLDNSHNNFERNMVRACMPACLPGAAIY